jgi:hypothetical protein
MGQGLTDTLLVFHLMGLMLGSGGGIGSTIAMARANKLPPEQGAVIRALGPILARTALAGLVLLLVTGFAMLGIAYGGFRSMPWTFWAKMTFVVTLTLAALLTELTYGQIRRGNTKAAANLPRLGPIAGISAFLAMIFAVLTFH